MKSFFLEVRFECLPLIGDNAQPMHPLERQIAGPLARLSARSCSSAIQKFVSVTSMALSPRRAFRLLLASLQIAQVFRRYKWFLGILHIFQQVPAGPQRRRRCDTENDVREAFTVLPSRRQ